eukprot:COSAG06_NODE_4596_length_4115_cov_4.491534_2_plen_403_part_00
MDRARDLVASAASWIKSFETLRDSSDATERDHCEVHGDTASVWINATVVAMVQVGCCCLWVLHSCLVVNRAAHDEPTSESAPTLAILDTVPNVETELHEALETSGNTKNSMIAASEEMSKIAKEFGLVKDTAVISTVAASEEISKIAKEFGSVKDTAVISTVVGDEEMSKIAKEFESKGAELMRIVTSGNYQDQPEEVEMFSNDRYGVTFVCLSNGILTTTENIHERGANGDNTVKAVRLLCAELARPPCSATGRLVVQQWVRGLLHVRRACQDYVRRHPEIHDIKIEAPLFIIGPPRTASSFLLRLLSQDPNFRCPKFWEINAPVPPPEEATYATDPRIKAAETGLASFNTISPTMLSTLRKFRACAFVARRVPCRAGTVSTDTARGPACVCGCTPRFHRR